MFYQFKNLYKQNGLKYFVRGLGTTCVRGIPVNAVLFPTVELVKHIVKFDDDDIFSEDMNEYS